MNLLFENGVKDERAEEPPKLTEKEILNAFSVIRNS